MKKTLRKIVLALVFLCAFAACAAAEGTPFTPDWYEKNLTATWEGRNGPVLVTLNDVKVRKTTDGEHTFLRVPAFAGAPDSLDALVRVKFRKEDGVWSLSSSPLSAIDRVPRKLVHHADVDDAGLVSVVAVCKHGKHPVDLKDCAGINVSGDQTLLTIDPAKLAAHLQKVYDANHIAGSLAETEVVYTLDAEGTLLHVEIRLDIRCVGQLYNITYTDGVAGETIFPDYRTRSVGKIAMPQYPYDIPTRTGYLFTGWKPAVGKYVWRDETYTATWKKIVCTVAYADGQGKILQTDKVNYGDPTPAAPTVPEREGYTFKGWDSSIAAKVTADVTYVAQWEEIPAPDTPDTPDTPSSSPEP